MLCTFNTASSCMILEEQNVIRGYQEVQVQTPTFSTCVLYFREVLKSSIFSQNSF